MRLLVISDIHANLAAFEAVLESAQGLWDQIWCLGDLIGYGPKPNECVALLREYDHVSLSGNHDWAALGKLDIADFNEDARAAVLWTRSALEPDTHAYLDALPPMCVLDNFTLAHASPRRPVWEYILDHETAAANFHHFNTPTCFVGHTHIPICVADNGPGEVLSYPINNDEPLFLEHKRFIVNPGSVGQPRDGDPRAAFALLDTENMSWEFRRILYPIEKTQRQMREENLPEPLVERLAHGW